MNIVPYFTYSVLIGGIIAIARFSKIRHEYYPFVFLIWVAGINEILSYVLFRYGYYNYINSNIYNLVESLLYLWFFKNIGVFNRAKFLFSFLALLFVSFWFFDNFVIIKFGSTYNSYFNILYSFVLVLLSINSINEILVREREIVKNPSFLICSGVIIFFTYSIFIEVFWLYGLGVDQDFSGSVYMILSWINLFCNLIYALAVLWMRKKQAFLLQF